MLINTLLLKAGCHYNPHVRQPRPEEIYHESVANSCNAGAFGARWSNGLAKRGFERAARDGDWRNESGDHGRNLSSRTARAADLYRAHALSAVERHERSGSAGTAEVVLQ
jgi:hypothetical protein